MHYRVIKEQSTWRRWVFRVAAVGTSAAIGGLGFIWGISVAELQISENAQLKEHVIQLDMENASLRSQLTDSELVIDTQNHTALALRDDLTELLKYKASMETELGFFRKIMVPGASDEGLHVERFNVRPGEGAEFVIETTLIQVAERPRVVAGSVIVEVEGTRSGVVENLTGADLGFDSTKLKFRFRYFQDLEQVITLPPDFEPSRVKVALVGDRRSPVEAEFVWPV